MQGDLDPLATVKTLTLLRYESSVLKDKLVIDLSGAPLNSDPAHLQSLNLQLVKESSDEQEALQALCHQQTPTDPCA